MSCRVYMPVLELEAYRFRLLWNGQAMIEWNTAEDGGREISMTDPAGMAALLCLMGREAAAVNRAYGYDADKVPGTGELEAYLRAAPAYELMRAMDSLNAALSSGTHRDYDPEKENGIDIDTLELKKN